MTCIYIDVKKIKIMKINYIFFFKLILLFLFVFIAIMLSGDILWELPISPSLKSIIVSADKFKLFFWYSGSKEVKLLTIEFVGTNNIDFVIDSFFCFKDEYRFNKYEFEKLNTLC